jgi:hypothetical protein
VRRGHVPATAGALDKIDAMDAIMELPGIQTTADIKLIRGEDMSHEQIKAIKDKLEGGLGTYHYQRTGFTSASIGMHEPGYQKHANVRWHFVVKKGARVLGIAGKIGHQEREVVLPHGISTEIYEMYTEGKHTIIKAIVR